VYQTTLLSVVDYHDQKLRLMSHLITSIMMAVSRVDAAAAVAAAM